MCEQTGDNVITLGFKKSPAGLLGKYRKARLNGFDITHDLFCVKIIFRDGSPQGEEGASAVLTFKDGFEVGCRTVYIVELGKGEV